MSNDSTKARLTHRIYSVTKNGDSKANWQEIASTWPHKDGKGFSLKFTARALDGAEIVLRTVASKQRSPLAGLAPLSSEGEGGIAASVDGTLMQNLRTTRRG